MSAHDNALVCKVCSDKASGRHYGVLSCDGCRGFFKRSVRNKHLKQYSCRGEKKCTITSATRNQCQYCRYQKCLSVNMNKDAVQHPRGQRTQKRSVPRMSSPGLQISAHNSHGDGSRSSAFTSAHLLPPSYFPLPVSISSFMQTLQLPVHAPTLSNGAALTWPLTQQLLKPTAVHPISQKVLNYGSLSSLSPISEVDHLDVAGRTSAFYRFPGEPLAGNSTGYCAWMKDMFLKIVDGMGAWVKDIAALTLLPLPDRVLLLEKCWCSLFILIAAELKLPFDIGLLMKNCVAANERDRLAVREVLQKVRRLVGSLMAMGLSRSNYVCLKATVIFNPEVKGLAQSNLVSSFRQQVLSCLHTPELSPLCKPSAAPRVDWMSLVHEIESVDAAVVEQILFPHLATGSISKMVGSAYKNNG